MNKKSRKKVYSVFLMILLGVLTLILVYIYYSLYHKIKDKPEEPATEVIEEEEKETEEEETTADEVQPEDESEKEKITISDMGFIFVGESHMVVADAEYAQNGSDIKDIEYNKNLFFVQTGLNGWMGTAEWLISEDIQDGEEGALKQIDAILDSHEFKKCYIFMQHGSSMSQYSDLWNTYEQVYHLYEERYPECELYVISVPPVQEEKFLEQTGIVRSNQSIQDFNEYTKGLLKEEQYLDYYSWFTQNGIYQDYIHFDGRTYKSLFTSIMGNILS